MNTRRPKTLLLSSFAFCLIAITSTGQQSQAASGQKYLLQAYACQYYGGGELSSVERTPVKIYNSGASSFDVLCPVLNDSTDCSGGTCSMAVLANLNDPDSGTNFTITLERRSATGGLQEGTSTTGSGSPGNTTLSAAVGFVVTSFYDLRVLIPSNSTSLFFSYWTQRQQV